MAVLCRAHALLFILTPRTGSSALARHLIDAYGGEAVPRDPARPRGVHKHATLAQVIASGVVSERERRGLWVFTTVRNPFDSIASYYQKRRNWARLPEAKRRLTWWWGREATEEEVAFAAEHDFETFVDRFVRPDGHPDLSRFLAGVDGALRFECLERDWQALLRERGVESQGPIPDRNVTSGRAAWRSYYTAAARRRIETVYEDLLQRFDYAFSDAED